MSTVNLRQRDDRVGELAGRAGWLLREDVEADSQRPLSRDPFERRAVDDLAARGVENDGARAQPLQHFGADQPARGGAERQVLTPMLGIADLRTDKRIDFVGGIRGTAELAHRIDSGRGQAAFAMYPVTMDDLFAISDAGEIMPPKSTWFEPKLRDGLLVHEI